MKVYFAHPVTDYGGTQRQLDVIKEIEECGWTVESPDKPWHQQGYDTFGMSYFTDLVGECDILVFLRFPSGKIGAGVGREIETALRRRMLVLDAANRFKPTTMMPADVLTIEETRAEIAELKKSAEPGIGHEGAGAKS